MAEETLTEADGDEDFVIVEEQAEPEQLPAEDTVPAGDGNDTVPAADADDDDEADDDRLGANEEEAAEQEADGRKKKRRERQRLAREAQTRELEELRAFRAAAEPRLAALEANTLGLNQTTLEQQIRDAADRAHQAEMICKAAEEAGNVSDARKADRIREEAEAELVRLQPALAEIKRLREQPGPQAQQPVDHMAAWQQANPWYRDGGMDENSVYARHIATEVLKGGQHGDIKLLGFWQEVTRRLNAAGGLGTEEKPPQQQQQAEKTGRKAPPTGTNREMPTASIRQQEVVLSPERVHAIKEAGAWDDPVARNRMVKRYLAYDKAAGQQGVS